MAGKVLNIKVCSPLKLRSGLIGNYHAICHYSYNLSLCHIIMRDQKLHIALLHIIGQQDKYKLDFEIEISTTEIFEKLKLDDYKIYQLILNDNQYIMTHSELLGQGIKFDKLERIKKTWFGLGTKTVSDLLVYPQTKFYYPYEFGNYTYIYSKNDYSKEQINDWLLKQFPNISSDLDKTYAGFNTESIELLNPQDFLIITNHDYQTEFGVIGNKLTIDKILKILRQMDLNNYDEMKYK